MTKGNWATQLRRGLVEFAVMALIAQRETYGYDIVERLQAMPGLSFTESTIYPVLTRLATDGFLRVRTDASAVGPPRRYYTLTASGERRLEQMSLEWHEVHGSITLLLKGRS